MEKVKLNHYRGILLKEKKVLQSTLEKIGGNEFSTNLQDEIGELSMFDNHPGDIATETYQMEIQYALDNHQKERLKNIDEALRKIEKGNYGVCEYCGNNISEARLEFMPEVKLCSQCAKERTAPKDIHGDRPIEEEVLYPPFSRTDTVFDLDDPTVYDREDA